MRSRPIRITDIPNIRAMRRIAIKAAVFTGREGTIPLLKKFTLSS